MRRLIIIGILWLATSAFADRAGDVLSEGFEGSWPPPGWAVLHLGDSHTWEPAVSLTHGGETAARVSFGPPGTSQDEWLVSGPLDLSGMNRATFEFYEDGAYWDSWGEHHTILASATSQTDVGGFTVILDMRPGIHEQGDFAGPPIQADLSAFAGEPEVYIAFRYEGENADHWFVDDCRIFEPFLHDIAVATVSPDDQHAPPGPCPLNTPISTSPGAPWEALWI